MMLPPSLPHPASSGAGLMRIPARTSARRAMRDRRRRRPSPDREASLFCAGIFLWGIWSSKWRMQLRRARRLSSERTMCHGANLVSVAANIASRAREYSNHRLREHRSVGLSFHCRSGSSMRARNRRFCSSSPTSSQYLISVMPPSTMNSSNSGQTLRKRRCCSSVQKPMTRSTPARLYQLRSKITISPAVGRWVT